LISGKIAVQWKAHLPYTMSTYVGLDKHGEINISTFIKHLQKIKDLYGDLRVVVSDNQALHDLSGSVVGYTRSASDGIYYTDDEGELTVILDQG